MRDKVTILVPATTANLGPGFDTLGMALDIRNALTVSVADDFAIEVEGEGAAAISRGPDNVIYQAIRTAFDRAGVAIPPLRLQVRSDIPLARGLGSSAAAVAGGLMAGNALCGGRLSMDDLLALGYAFEGHPDNVTPALLGGCVASAVVDGKVAYARVPLPENLRTVLFIPDFEMPTKEARAILPDPVRRADAVFNLGRVALLVAALSTGRLDLLRTATEDRLHQPPRQAVFPAMPLLFQAAIEAGALGAFLSGAGSTVIALCVDKEEAIGAALAAAAGRASLSGRILATRPSDLGAGESPDHSSSRRF
ncbi:MAG: homoserine kinase [Chloroflexi bacterium]|nr:homoserine kinase [Chloroflexota bacterium]